MPQFVILSQPRCGTHMLATMLNSHPDIHCVGEMFNKNSITSSIRRKRLTMNLKDQLHAIWLKTDGFCVHSYQESDWPGIHEEIAKRNPKIIWLRRRDRFMQALSCRLAHESKLWPTIKEHEPLAANEYHIELDDMVSFIDSVDQLSNRDLPIFSRCEQIKVDYEELVDGSCIKPALDFLELKHFPLVPTTHLARKDPDLSKYIPNWEDLKEQFDEVYRNRRR